MDDVGVVLLPKPLLGPASPDPEGQALVGLHLVQQLAAEHRAGSTVPPVNWFRWVPVGTDLEIGARGVVVLVGTQTESVVLPVTGFVVAELGSAAQVVGRPPVGSPMVDLGILDLVQIFLRSAPQRGPVV